MHVRVKITHVGLDRSTNLHIGRNIGELCKRIAGKKLTAEDYAAVARLRSEMKYDRQSVLDAIQDESLSDAVKLMPVFMAAYLLHVVQNK